MATAVEYLKDGINALNTAFLQDGVFIHVKKGITVEHPVYIYNITDARSENIFSQPRTLPMLVRMRRIANSRNIRYVGITGKLYQPGDGNCCGKRCKGRVL